MFCQQGGEGFDMAEAHCVIGAQSGFVDTAGDAVASASYGTLRGFAQMQTTNADGNDYDASATSEFTDTLTITAPGHAPGSSGQGKMFFTIDADHLIIEHDITTGFAYADTDFFLTVNGNSASPQGTIPDLFYFVSFKYGEPFEITASLQTRVICSDCEGRYDIVNDAQNTATLDVMTVTGLELEDFTVNNESGQLYANTVPEPGSTTGALTALGALVALLLRKRRSRLDDQGELAGLRPPPFSLLVRPMRLLSWRMP